MTVSSTFTLGAGVTFTHNSGTVTFNGLASPTLTCNSKTFNLVTFTHTGGTKTVSSDCSFPLGSTPTIGSGGGGSITLNGTLSGSGTLTASGGTLRLNAGSSLSGFSGFSGSGLNIQGATANFGSYSPMTVSGTFTLASGTFTAPSGTMSLNSTITITGGTFTHNSGTVNIASTGSATLACNNVSFNAVTINHSSGTRTINSDCSFPLGSNPTTATGGLITLNGTLSGSGTLSLGSSGTANTLTLNAGSSLSGFSGFTDFGTLTVAGATANFGTYSPVTINNNFTLSSGTFTAPSGTMTIAKAMTISGGTFTANGGTLTFTMTTSSALACNSATFNLVTFTHTANTATVNSDCSLPLGSNPTVGSSGGGSLTLNGTLSGTGTLTFSGGTFTMNTGSSLSGFGGLAANSLIVAGATANFGAYSPMTVASLFTLSAGTFTAPSGTMSVAGAFTINFSGTFVHNGGTLNFNGASGASLSCNSATFNLVTFTHTSGNKTIGSACTFPLGNNPTIGSGTGGQITLDGTLSGTGTLTVGASGNVAHFALDSTGVLSGFGGLITNGNYTQSGGTQNFGAYSTFDVNNSFGLNTAASFTAPSGTMTVALNFNNNSGTTFTHNNGTVVLDGSGVTQIILSDVTFYNLSKTETTNDATDTTISMTASATVTIASSLTLDGLDNDDRINIVSGTPGATSSIDFKGSSTFTGDYLDVSDSTVTDNSSGVALPLVPANSIDSGNNVGWFGAAVSGTAYTDEGVTTMGAGRTVRLLVDGVDTGATGSTSGGGAFSIDYGTAIANGAVLTVYLDDQTENGVTVTRYNGVGTVAADIYQDFLVAQHEDAGPLTTANLDTANNADPGGSGNDITSIYDVSGGTLSVVGGSTLRINAGKTLSTNAIDDNGSLHILGTLNAAANAISVAGNLDNDGTLTHTGTLTFDGSGAQTVNQGTVAIGSDVSVTNSASTVSLIDNDLNIGANDLTIGTNATLVTSGKNVTANGTFSNDGTLRRTGLETISISQDTNSGVWQYVGNNDGSSDPITIQDFGGTDYFTLAINDTAGTQDAYSLGSPLHVTTLTITSGPLDTTGQTLDVDGALSDAAAGSLTLGASTVTVGGGLTLNGTFAANTSSVTLDGVNQTIAASGPITFYDLAKSDASNDSTDRTLTMPASVTIDIGNSLTLDGLDANDRVNIVSSTPTTQSTLNFTGSSTFTTAGFLDVTDSAVTDNSSGVTVPLNPANSINGGNTSNWFGFTISGTVYTDEGVTNIGVGKTVRLLINGANSGSTNDTNGSGQYSITYNDIVASGAVLTLYLDDEAENGVTVTRFDGSVAVPSLDIYQDFLVAQHEDAGPLTTANLDTANNADPGGSGNDITSIYDVAAGTLTSTATSTLRVNSGKTLSTGAVDVNGSLHILGILSSGANAINVAGNLDNDGTLTHTGTLTLDGTIAQTCNAGGSAIGSDLSSPTPSTR
ncbi:MAG: hypothetical protein U0514_00085 [Candidatus Andersenbacteria bacterium]